MKATIKDIQISCFSHGYTVELERDDGITMRIPIKYEDDLQETILDRIKERVKRLLEEEERFKQRERKWYQLKQYIGTTITIEGDT